MGADLQLTMMLRAEVAESDAEWIWPWLKAISRKQRWFDDVWWCLMMFDDVWWCMMDDAWCHFCVHILQAILFRHTIWLCGASWSQDLAVCSLLSSFLEDSWRGWWLSPGKISKQIQRIHEDAGEGLAVLQHDIFHFIYMYIYTYIYIYIYIYICIHIVHVRIHIHTWSKRNATRKSGCSAPAIAGSWFPIGIGGG